MLQGETITHEGIVKKASGKGTAEVEILAGSACSGCHAKSACSLGDIEVKTITVKTESHLSPGDRVIVTMEQSQGFRAVLLGYIFPFVVLLVVFVLLYIAGAGDLVSSLLSFAAVACYYALVWLFRKKVEKKFEFKIKN